MEKKLKSQYRGFFLKKKYSNFKLEEGNVIFCLNTFKTLSKNFNETIGNHFPKIICTMNRKRCFEKIDSRFKDLTTSWNM